MTIRSTLALAFCSALAACGGGADDDGAGDDDDGGVDTDGGAGSDGGGDGVDDDACRKIDLVISVDPSSSMSQELAAMSTIFGEFATALLDVNEEFENFRTGVVDACPRPAAFNTMNQSGASCGFASGQGWIDSASASMVSEFQCVGDISTQFDCDTNNDEDEQPIKAAIGALQAGVNPDFVRDDALLVVLGITDEDEEMVLDGGGGATEETYVGAELASHAQGLYDDLVAVKGDVRRLVFVSIAGAVPDGCSNGAFGAAQPAEIMDATADLFIAEQRGVKWDLCQGNLDEALSEALLVIDRACDDFPPVE